MSVGPGARSAKQCARDGMRIVCLSYGSASFALLREEAIMNYPLRSLSCDTGRKGVASILALAVLTILVAISATMATQSFLEFRKSDSLSRATQARLSAESGMAYMTKVVRDIRLSNDVDATTFMDEFHTALSELLAPMSNAGVTVTKVGQTVQVSEVELPNVCFSCEFTLDTSADPPSTRMTVTGRSGDFVRQTAVTYACVGKRSSVFDFGVASRGKIVISGSASLLGVNGAYEASVLSTREHPVAIEAGGHAFIDGDLYVTGDDVDYVYLKGGGLSIGGTSDYDEILNDHVYVGTQEPDFPEIDTDQFIPLAVNLIDSSTNLNGGNTYSNIRIAAGTDPHFPSDTVINGVMYVEAPNCVTFAAQTTINGLVVTEDGAGTDIDDCQIDFRGASSAPGVEALPDTSEFAAIKTHTGTVILAPGFGVSFRGSSNSINGLIAADRLSFLGNSNISGDVAGSIIGLSDYELNLKGNATIRISRPDSGSLPAGFKHPFGLEPQADTYSEPVP